MNDLNEKILAENLKKSYEEIFMFKQINREISRSIKFLSEKADNVLLDIRTIDSNIQDNLKLAKVSKQDSLFTSTRYAVVKEMNKELYKSVKEYEKLNSAIEKLCDQQYLNGKMILIIRREINEMKLSKGYIT